MPMKKLVISFELDAELFARMLLHQPMNINVLGEGPPPQEDVPRVTHTSKKTGRRMGKKMLAVLNALADAEIDSLDDIRRAVREAGFSDAVNSTLHAMMADKLIRRSGYAKYSITKKGLSHVSA